MVCKHYDECKGRQFLEKIVETAKALEARTLSEEEKFQRDKLAEGGILSPSLNAAHETLSIKVGNLERDIKLRCKDSNKGCSFYKNIVCSKFPCEDVILSLNIFPEHFVANCLRLCVPGMPASGPDITTGRIICESMPKEDLKEALGLK